MILWRYFDTDSYYWSFDCPGPGWEVFPAVYEDELPEDITDDDFDAWFELSTVIDGVRVGPKITEG